MVSGCGFPDLYFHVVLCGESDKRDNSERQSDVFSRAIPEQKEGERVAWHVLK